MIPTSLKQDAEQLVEYGARMVADGLVTGTSGNISVRRDDAVMITPSSVPYDQLTADQICVLDADGHQTAGAGPPSSEAPMHRAVYRGTTARAVVHTHSPYATVLSTVVERVPAIHYAMHRFGGDDVRVSEYERFGSERLATAATTALIDRRGALLRNHGAIVYGDSLAEAYELASCLEWLCMIYWHARLIGAPHIVDSEQVRAVASEARRRRYGANPYTSDRTD